MSVNRSAGRDPGQADGVVVRKGTNGWVVGNENVSDLTSAMVLADLLAAEAEHAASRQASGGNPGSDHAEAADGFGTTSRAGGGPLPPEAGRGGGGRGQSPPSVRSTMSSGGATGRTSRGHGSGTAEAERLAVTVTQLEHALASRVRVEQAIGVLAERHRLRPREAFDLLRQAARSRGSRVTEIARDVVASASNPLLRLPDELARKLPEPRQRGRSMRRAPRHAQRA